MSKRRVNIKLLSFRLCSIQPLLPFSIGILCMQSHICVVCCFLFLFAKCSEMYKVMMMYGFFLGVKRMETAARSGSSFHFSLLLKNKYMHLIEKFDCLSFSNYIHQHMYNVQCTVYTIAQQLYGYISFSLFK